MSAYLMSSDNGTPAYNTAGPTGQPRTPVGDYVNIGEPASGQKQAAPVPSDADSIYGGHAAAGSVVQGEPLYPQGSAGEPNGNRFVSQGYKDLWAAAVFIVHAIGVLLAAVIHGVHWRRYIDDGQSDVNRKAAARQFGYAFSATGIAAVLAFGALLLMRAHPRVFIWTANLALSALTAAAGVIMLIKGATWGGIVALLAALIGVVVVILLRHRIPLAAVLLRFSAQTVLRYPGTMVVAALGLAVAVVYQVVWIAAVFPSVKAINADHGNRAAYAAMLFGLLCLFWTSQVIINVVHVTASGTVASWYFFGGANMPRSPAASAFKRAVTTSFGSICFGSLIVAVLKLIEFMVRAGTRHSNGFVRCIALCLIGCITSLVRYFNVYAFTHVAIYGSGYVDAAKQTFEFITHSGWTAVINDSLVWPVLSFSTFFGALLTAAVLGAGTKSFVVGIAAFSAAYVTLLVLLRAVYSGIVTLLVCVAECPEVMAVTNPGFAMELDQAASEARAQRDVAEERL